MINRAQVVSPHHNKEFVFVSRNNHHFWIHSASLCRSMGTGNCNTVRKCAGAWSEANGQFPQQIIWVNMASNDTNCHACLPSYKCLLTLFFIT